jgi:hypothetical protein
MEKKEKIDYLFLKEEVRWNEIGEIRERKWRW